MTRGLAQNTGAIGTDHRLPGLQSSQGLQTDLVDLIKSVHKEKKVVGTTEVTRQNSANWEFC